MAVTKSATQATDDEAQAGAEAKAARVKKRRLARIQRQIADGTLIIRHIPDAPRDIALTQVVGEYSVAINRGVRD